MKNIKKALFVMIAASSMAHAEVSSQNVMTAAESSIMAIGNISAKDAGDWKGTEARKYFTEKGWRSYTDALAKSGNLKWLQENKIDLSMKVKKTELMSSKGEAGNHQWMVKVLSERTFSGKETKTAKIKNLLVLKESGDAALIDQIVMIPQDPDFE